MISISKCLMAVVAFVAAASFFYAAPASAQATRTWVSGVGDDANPCSRTAPCKTFAGAISKTAAGGEINCIDPGGFGGVTITKSISIICEDIEAGVLVSGTNGIVVNAGINDVIVLKGLDIEGVGTGANGIRFLAGGALHVIDCSISDFRAGWGISFQPGAASRLYVQDTVLLNNGNGTSGGGILMQPTGTGSGVAYFNNVNAQNNGGAAFSMNTTNNTGPGIYALMTDSQLAGSQWGVNVTTPGVASAVAVLVNTTIMNNGTGILADGGGARADVSGSSVVSNVLGVSSVNGGFLTSYLDNRLDRNGTDGNFNGSATKK